ncbi:MAG TPA: hypothetical protein VIJ12_02565 [Candidatus Baltobacteraceae bacterium]
MSWTREIVAFAQGVSTTTTALSVVGRSVGAKIADRAWVTVVTA